MKLWVKITLILGIIGFVLLQMFGLQGYLETITPEGAAFTMYRFNFNAYLQAIKYAWTDTNNLWYLPINTSQFTTNVQNVNDLWNNIKAALQLVLITPINMILWLFRLMAWFVKGILAILGWSGAKYPITVAQYHWDANQLKFVYGTNEILYYESKVMRILDWIQRNLIIPYF